MCVEIYRNDKLVALLEVTCGGKTAITCLSFVVPKLWFVGDSVDVTPLDRIRTSKPENQNVCGTCPTFASA